MTEDLLTRIQRETHERLCELRGAVDEHDRLTAELSDLDLTTEPPVDQEMVTGPAVVPGPAVAPEPPVAPELPVAPESPAAPEAVVDPEPSANVVRLPARTKLPRARMVSPKVARLMRAPRRPALERSGVVRVGAGRGAGSSPADDRWPQEMGEEPDELFLSASGLGVG